MTKFQKWRERKMRRKTQRIKYAKIENNWIQISFESFVLLLMTKVPITTKILFSSRHINWFGKIFSAHHFSLWLKNNVRFLWLEFEFVNNKRPPAPLTIILPIDCNEKCNLKLNQWFRFCSTKEKIKEEKCLHIFVMRFIDSSQITAFY